MGFFSSQRSQKGSPVQQIESLNTRLERARQIVTEGRIFRALSIRELTRLLGGR